MTKATLRPTTAEKKVIDAAAEGRPADFQTGNKQQDDPSNGAAWGKERTVRAELIYTLCAGLNPDWKVSPRGLFIRGAKISGTPDLRYLDIKHPLGLRNCWCEGSVRLTDAKTRSLGFTGCHVGGVEASRLSADGSIFFDDGFTTVTVDLVDANIKGSVSFDSAHLMNPKGRALAASRISISGALYCGGFKADGEIEFVDATIGGSLDCDGATLSNPDGVILGGDRLDVGSIYLGAGFTSVGEIRLVSAKIGGVMILGGARGGRGAGRH